MAFKAPEDFGCEKSRAAISMLSDCRYPDFGKYLIRPQTNITNHETAVRDLAETFGRELINARKFKGITLEQISDLTKIQLRYL